MEPKSQALIDWLLARYPETPRTRAKQWILAGRVRVNGAIVRKPQQVMSDPGERLELLQRHSTTLDCGNGWQIHPRVLLLYIDAALSVVSKGAGTVAVPAPNAQLSALSVLQDFLAGRLKPRDRSVSERVLPARYRRLILLPVHRLDQYTSGVFCMACNPVARAHLIAQLKKRTMKREYVAFVQGRASQPTGSWRDWMELSEDQMRQRIVPSPRPGGRHSEAVEAITHYEVLAEYRLGEKSGFVTKLRLRLETGRKHQIRLQAASAGLPIIGDRTYHPGYRPGAVEAALIEFSRQALHAERLTLEHPEVADQIMNWRADLPPDLRQLEAKLDAHRI